MKILVLDRDSMTSRMTAARLEEAGHTVAEETVKNSALARLEAESFDVVIIDPAPLSDARPLILSIRRSVRQYVYIVLSGEGMTEETALKMGANAALPKPQDGARLVSIAESAERFTALVRRIGDENEDFPSAGGVIAKSAFNQLFLSAIDRADRYAEQSYILFIGIQNYHDILSMDGAYAAEYATAKLSQYLVHLRRQSDIIAQTGKGEYALLLQRPAYETEPMEAASRFAEALGNLQDIREAAGGAVKVGLSLIDVPSGGLHAEHQQVYS